MTGPILARSSDVLPRVRVTLTVTNVGEGPYQLTVVGGHRLVADVLSAFGAALVDEVER